MLHVVTEIGKSGRNEREKRHYPELYNNTTKQKNSIRCRRYIPHGYGDDSEFRPHPHAINPHYTECGPDWKSRLRYIPSPTEATMDYKPEIWPDPWKSLRTYPGTTLQTKDEWTFYPEGYDVTLRSKWDGVHKSTERSSNEVTDNMRLGKSKQVIDKRNGIYRHAPGDKSYQAVEYSPSFHKYGSTLPVVNFGGTKSSKPDTFVPLHPLSREHRPNFMEKEAQRKKEQEMLEVWKLERWRPATPLINPNPIIIQEERTSSLRTVF